MMKRGRFPLLVLLGAALFVATIQSAEGEKDAAAQLLGTWRWDFAMPDGTTVRPKLKFRADGERITGMTSYRPDSETAVTNLVVRGNEVSFQVIREREGEAIATAYHGVWSSNAIVGKIESNWLGEKRAYDWNARRANLGVEGVWRWTNSFFAGFGGRGGGRAQETRVELEQEGKKVTGKTVSRSGRPVSISHGTITNGLISFEIERVIFNNKFVTKFEGEQMGDTIKGTMESEIEGETRTIDWEATRVD